MMFNKATETISRDRHSQSIIQEGVSVKGEVQATGEVRLDGVLEGRISAQERLTIGASGVVRADIDAGEVIVMGSVEGKIRAGRRLELRKGARVIGDVSTPILVIEEGVHFHGNSNMNAEAQSPALGVLTGGRGDGKREGTKEDAVDALVPR
jgi:cytoskeletal protein CcmA (bactofilin family)